MSKFLLLFLILALPFPLGGSVDTRIFDGSSRERTEAEEGQQGEIDPDARTGWQRDKKEESTDEAKKTGDKDGQKEAKSPQSSTPPKPAGLPPPPEPAARKGLPPPPEPSQRQAEEEGGEGKNEDEAAPPSGRPSPGVRASPQLQGVSLDVALPFPSDI